MGHEGVANGLRSERRGLRVFADRQVFDEIQRCRPDVMARLRTYQKLDDPAEEPIVLLPDLAPDHGLPVGATLVTSERVLPYAFGMDPGCGFGCWLLKGLREAATKERLRKWVAGAVWEPVVDEPSLMHDVVFSGSTFAGTTLDSLGLIEDAGEQACRRLAPLSDRVKELIAGLLRQSTGKLAVGNHFIELHAVEQAIPQAGIGPDDLLLVIHNGSLEIGYLVQKYGLRIAAGETQIDSAHLPFLSLRADSRAGEEYFAWHQWAVRFATANRAFLAARAIAALSVGVGQIDAALVADTMHSGITRLAAAGGVRWRHQSGTQGLEPGHIGFVGGTVGGPSFLVTGGPAAASALGTISHGSGQQLIEAEQETCNAIVTNLPQATLRALQAKFRSAEASVRLLEAAALAAVVARTVPLAAIKYIG